MHVCRRSMGRKNEVLMGGECPCPLVYAPVIVPQWIISAYVFVCLQSRLCGHTHMHQYLPTYIHVYIYTQLYTHVINVNVCTQVRLHRSECKEGQNVFVRILTRRHARNKIARARYVYYSCMYTRAYSGIYVHTAICYMLACGRLCLRTSLHTYTDT